MGGNNKKRNGRASAQVITCILIIVWLMSIITASQKFYHSSLSSVVFQSSSFSFATECLIHLSCVVAVLLVVFLLQAVRPEAFGMDLWAWSTVIIPSVVQANANINLFVQQRRRASAENYGSSVPNAILPSPLKWGLLSFRKLLLQFEFIRLVVADYTSNFTAPSGYRDQYSQLSFPHIEMEQDEWFTV